MNIGQQRDFYKLKDLTAEDVDFIRKLAIEPAQGHLRKLHINLINKFTSIFKIKSALDSKGIDDAEINDMIDFAIHNLEEDLHGGIENIGEKYLKLLYEKNTEFWTNENDAPEQIELYYPIAPKLAVLLKEKPSDTNVINLSDDDVKKYNDYIENYAHEQLYAISPNDLKSFF